MNIERLYESLLLFCTSNMLTCTSPTTDTTGVHHRSSEIKCNELNMQQTTQNSPPSTTVLDGEEATVVRTHQSRKRLRPWLEGLINDGSVKGLEWIDKDKKLFKIPWKHAGKQDYNQDEDSKIFKLWSLNTGKFKPGIHIPEPAVWKTRLRTALNKLPDIDEIHEKTQLDIPEPYRVYRLLPKKPSNNSLKNRMSTSPGYGHPDHRVVSSHTSYGGRYNPYVDHRSSSFLNGSYSQLMQSNYHHQNNGTWFDPVRPVGVDPAAYSYGNYNNLAYNPTSSAHDLELISDVITEDINGSHAHQQAGQAHQQTNHAHYPTNGGHVYDQEGALTMEQGARLSKLENVGVADTLVNNNDPQHVNYHDLVSMPTVTSSEYTSCAKIIPPPSYDSCMAATHAHSFTTTTTTAGAGTCAVTMPTDSVTMDTTDMSNHQLSQQQPGGVSPVKRMRSCSEPTLPDDHVMEIKISYQSTEAGYQYVDNPEGCMLYYNQPWEEGIRRGMEAVHLPDISAVSAHSGMTRNQMVHTSEALRCFEKGMSIECRGGNIYVTRRCRSAIFWCTHDSTVRQTKLERDVEVKVFDLAQFNEQLRRYYLGEDAPPIFPEIYFTVAQKWSPTDMPLHACLISIVVTPLRACEEMRTISPEIHSLPHSIHSGLLHISGTGPGPDCSPGNLWNDVTQNCDRRMSAMV